MCWPPDEPDTAHTLLTLLYSLEEVFPQASIPVKVLSHLRIPEQGPARAYRTDTTRNAVLSKARAPLGLDPLQGTLCFSQGFRRLLQDELPSCTGHLVAPIGITPDAGV